MKYFLGRLPAPRHRVLRRGDAQRLHGLELRPAVQVSRAPLVTFGPLNHSFIKYPLGWDKAPKHFLVPTVINSPHSQEFMVSRILSVVLILLEPLMDVNSSMKGSNKMSTTEKILETMNS